MDCKFGQASTYFTGEHFCVLSKGDICCSHSIAWAVLGGWVSVLGSKCSSP
jgi:hypothetical protein